MRITRSDTQRIVKIEFADKGDECRVISIDFLCYNLHTFLLLDLKTVAHGLLKYVVMFWICRLKGQVGYFASRTLQEPLVCKAFANRIHVKLPVQH